MNLFIFQAGRDPLFFVAVVVTVIISIVLHELAHGWAAIRLGDDTPRIEGRMVPDPLLHMGPFSLLALMIAGIAWGAMPINPSRLRGRHGGAIVAVAGPVTNLVLGILCLTVLAILMRTWEPNLMLGGVMQRQTPDTLTQFQTNLLFVLAIAGIWNLVLTLFNLLPIPPLDGSHILASFHRGYDQFISNPANQVLMLMGFIFLFAMADIFFTWSIRFASFYTELLINL